MQDSCTYKVHGSGQVVTEWLAHHTYTTTNQISNINDSNAKGCGNAKGHLVYSEILAYGLLSHVLCVVWWCLMHLKMHFNCLGKFQQKTDYCWLYIYILYRRKTLNSRYYVLATKYRAFQKKWSNVLYKKSLLKCTIFRSKIGPSR